MNVNKTPILLSTCSPKMYSKDVQPVSPFLL